MEIIISIVVPAYNVGPYIAECLKSVQKQVYTEWELIVVNDGSKDNTYSIAKEIADLDSRILLYTQENQGVSVARNVGLQLSKGKYIIFLDGDDFWEPECLSELLTAIQSSRADFSYCGYRHAYGAFARNYRYQYADGDVLLKALQGKVRFQLGAVLIDRTFLMNSKIVFTEGCLIGQDLEFMLKLAGVASVKSVDKNLLMYRVRPQSAITSNWDWRKRIHAIYGYLRAADFISLNRKNDINWRVIKQELDKGIATKIYKFLWRTIKSQAYQEAMQLIRDERFSYYLSLLDKQDLSIINRVKLRLVMSQKICFWKLVRFL